MNIQKEKVYLCGHHPQTTMTRWLKYILLIITFTLTNTMVKAAEAQPLDNDSGLPSYYLQQKSNRQQAILTDTSEILQVCNSQPEQYISIEQVTTSHPNNKYKLTFDFKGFSYRHYNGKYFAFTNRILSMPQCRYYVFALGHMLCQLFVSFRLTLHIILI